MVAPPPCHRRRAASLGPERGAGTAAAAASATAAVAAAAAFLAAAAARAMADRASCLRRQSARPTGRPARPRGPAALRHGGGGSDGGGTGRGVNATAARVGSCRTAFIRGRPWPQEQPLSISLCGPTSASSFADSNIRGFIPASDTVADGKFQPSRCARHFAFHHAHSNPVFLLMPRQL